MSVGDSKRMADLVRETLESYVPSATSSRVLFAALRRFGREPTERSEMVSFVQSVDEALHLQVDVDTREAIVERLHWLFVQGPASHPPPAPVADFSEDLADGEDPSVTRAMPTSLLKPVPVLVASSDALLGTFIDASLGRHRSRVVTVDTLVEFRHAVFAHSPLVVVVDAFEPPSLSPEGVLRAAEQSPDQVVSVLWGRDAPWATPITQAQSGARWVFLSEDDGFGPLLDLIASRYGG